MISRTFKVSAVLLTALAVSACSDSEPQSSGTASNVVGLIGQPTPLVEPDDTDPVSPVNTDPEVQAIAGLWNNSLVVEDTGAINVFYLEITPSGVWNNYDFRGDNVNQGDNCYVLNTATITGLGNGDFRVSFPGGVLEFNAVVSAGRLVITGNLGTVTLPALVGLSPTDFNLC